LYILIITFVDQVKKIAACSVYVSILKIERLCLAESPINFYHTIRRQISPDSIIHNHHGGDLKFHRKLSSAREKYRFSLTWLV
jgi:hypothetical protein